MSNKAHKAKHLLVHYMRQLARNSGTLWNWENDNEVESIVDMIIEAAAEEVAERHIIHKATSRSPTATDDPAASMGFKSGR